MKLIEIEAALTFYSFILLAVGFGSYITGDDFFPLVGVSLLFLIAAKGLEVWDRIRVE